jgi:AcrR family transcriptional regulator
MTLSNQTRKVVWMSTNPEPRAEAPPRRKVGRPARLSQELIVEAAYALGLENVTMKTVAEHLGVSVPGLYHYVRGREDLLRLAAEFSANRIEVPTDHGQHWAIWLYEWAMYNFNAFVADPGLLKRYIDGAISGERTARAMNTALGSLVEQGFTIHDARLVYGLVSEMAIGAAMGAARERQAATDGRPTLAELHRVLLGSGDRRDLPHLRAMLADATLNPTTGLQDFEDRLVVVLRGIAAGRGERWERIAAELERFTAGR